ncbi:GtrA family protein [Labrys wisconsinensis]|uniref:Flippase GtrA n=1 Tax=Labrys wisconsinensis TaxID=425677 RepID=A0ABU0J529_9HYPH|nr:GtrA family protein [Labrys wisconsinensis]MDQ0469375.1 putative flippase GtrA [Labrys wisconsinensis]
MRLSARIARFLVAGAAGFVVDVGVLSALVWCGADPRPARLVSFLAAMTLTWQINRVTTFGDRAGPATVAEFLRYAMASGLAALINLGVYMGLVTWGGAFRTWPVLAVAIATALSMTVNFLSYLKLVFSPRPR